MTIGDGDEGSGDEGSGVELQALVRTVLDRNVYMVLGTADAAGRPWASPVFYAAGGYRQLYWVSSPDVTHSLNLAERPDVGIVVFDSRAPVHTGHEGAVHMTATVAQVAADELDTDHLVYRTFASRGRTPLAPADLEPPSPYRMYRATVTEHSVLCPRLAGTPCARHGWTYDHRTSVDLPHA
jgi:nitroimidazol reductase NimA-like FMN-containing flavoprotein (pyridoxamine 5'-phosphate oxidase superfamily)